MDQPGATSTTSRSAGRPPTCRALGHFGERSPFARPLPCRFHVPSPAGSPADRLRADAARPSTSAASCRRGSRKCPVGRIKYPVLPRVPYRLTRPDGRTGGERDARDRTRRARVAPVAGARNGARRPRRALARSRGGEGAASPTPPADVPPAVHDRPGPAPRPVPPGAEPSRWDDRARRRQYDRGELHASGDRLGLARPSPARLPDAAGPPASEMRSRLLTTRFLAEGLRRLESGTAPEREGGT